MLYIARTLEVIKLMKRTYYIYGLRWSELVELKNNIRSRYSIDIIEAMESTQKFVISYVYKNDSKINVLKKCLDYVQSQGYKVSGYDETMNPIAEHNFAIKHRERIKWAEKLGVDYLDVDIDEPDKLKKPKTLEQIFGTGEELFSKPDADGNKTVHIGASYGNKDTNEQDSSKK